MSERYTRVFSLKENLYSKNSPVVICAGALLKDNVKDTVLAQIKIKNISDRVIKAVRVTVTTFDVSNALLDENIRYEYLDLAAARDAEFGQKEPILLDDKSARSFTVCVNEVIFSDGSSWNYGGEEWKSITTQKVIDNILNDSQLVKQYKLEYGLKSHYEATADRDLWICTCGHINHIGENICPICSNKSDLLSGVNTEELIAKKEQRLIKEKEEADIQKKKAKKNKIITIAVALAILVIIGSIAAVTSYSIKIAIYNEAVTLFEENENQEAMELFSSLGSFKDSESYAVYATAIAILETPSTYQQYDDFMYLRAYREDMKSKFDDAKATIEAFDGEKNQALEKLYNQINLALEYYGKWKVVSGNKSIAFEYKEGLKYEKVSFVIDYAYGEVVLYLVPHNLNDSGRVWGGGLYTGITDDEDQPFECVNGDENKCKISSIKNDKVVIKEYKKGKVVDELTFEKLF